MSDLFLSLKFVFVLTAKWVAAVPSINRAPNNLNSKLYSHSSQLCHPFIMSTMFQQPSQVTDIWIRDPEYAPDSIGFPSIWFSQRYVLKNGWVKKASTSSMILWISSFSEFCKICAPFRICGPPQKGRMTGVFCHHHCCLCPPPRFRNVGSPLLSLVKMEVEFLETKGPIRASLDSERMLSLGTCYLLAFKLHLQFLLGLI